ncbi:MAG: hypothetical protein HON68_01190 [Gammaproteobacteria bacterium]|nr:hypothetical protein [Gammaproteobacteria bacterium]MBT3490597.1 hypothetical protein [Gammaproteobacteria bacterium]MBT3718051.1 hypothetical protein [Gammaproteobacteria bacterium]MBT3844864.1 hypothetical protein [Gammaproteobacteria bacterium]MBT3891995.1 hypothetical protein [Gammaproteobacteria bacterium]
MPSRSELYILRFFLTSTILLWVCGQPLQAACLSEDELSVVLLLPLDSDEHPLGDALLSGFIEGELEQIAQPCNIILQQVSSLNEEEGFLQQWNRALELEPDLLVGPFLRENQKQLAELDVLAFPEQMVWLYPGEIEQIQVTDPKRVFSFSVANGSRLRTLLEYGWDQGQYDILALLPESEAGHRLGGQMRAQWEEKGGVMRTGFYGNYFGQLNAVLRKLIAESRGVFDLLLIVADDQRLRMARPLMNYQDREEPIFSLTAPVDRLRVDKDLDELYFPMQPLLLEREVLHFDVDDILLQVENVGFDLMMLLRRGIWSDLLENGSYFGRSGRYTIEQGRLLRMQCIAKVSFGKFRSQFCPEPVVEVFDEKSIE